MIMSMPVCSGKACLTTARASGPREAAAVSVADGGPVRDAEAKKTAPRNATRIAPSPAFCRSIGPPEKRASRHGPTPRVHSNTRIWNEAQALHQPKVNAERRGDGWKRSVRGL